MPGHVEPRQLHPVLQDEAPLLRQRGGRANGRRARPRGQVAEIAFGQIEGFRGVHVASQHQRGVAGPVIGAEEVAHVVELHGVQVGHVADGRPPVWVLEWKQPGHQRHQRQAIRPILVALSPFVQHHLALGLEPLRGQRRQQIPHAVRLHPQRPVDGARGHHLPIVRAIGVGGAVQLRAGLLQRREVPAVVVLRPFEHQVFEEMGEPGPPWLLVLRPDVVPDVDGHDRHAVILVHDHVETVAESPPGKRQVQRGSAAARQEQAPPRPDSI